MKNVLSSSPIFSRRGIFLLGLTAVLLTTVNINQPAPNVVAETAVAPNNLCFRLELPIIIGGSGVGGPIATPVDPGHTYEPCDGFPDFNGDGYADLAIGVPDEDVTQGAVYVDAGAVHVIYGTSHGLEAFAVDALVDDQIWHRAVDGLGIIGLDADDVFGQALGIGDFNNDGYDDLAIGVPGSMVAGLDGAGAVQVLYGTAAGLTSANTQTWTQESVGVDDTAGALDGYGESLTSADFDGDGYDDLAVGIPHETVDGNDSAGAINILYGSQNGLKSSLAGLGKPDEFLTQGTIVFTEVVEPDDLFGHTLITGNFNDDAYADLAVGVPFEDNGAGFDNAGAVQIFYGSKNGIIDPELGAIAPMKITADTPGVDNAMEANDLFGFSLAAADFNGDGTDDLAIGTPYETHGVGGGALQFAGAVNIVLSESGSLRPDLGARIWHQDSVNMKGAAAGFEYFGWDLEAADFDNDGYADLAIGVLNEHDPAAGVLQIGAVHMMYGRSGGLAANDNLIIYDPENPAEGDAFGAMLTAVDSNGDGYPDLVVGAYLDDPLGAAASNIGSVFVFHSNNDGVSQTDNQNWYQGHNGLIGAQELDDHFGKRLP